VPKWLMHKPGQKPPPYKAQETVVPLSGEPPDAFSARVAERRNALYRRAALDLALTGDEAPRLFRVEERRDEAGPSPAIVLTLLPRLMPGQVKAATESPVIHAGEDLRAGDVLTLSPADGLLHRCRARDIPFAVAASDVATGQPVPWIEEQRWWGPRG
jgi:hypothetical protein